MDGFYDFYGVWDEPTSPKLPSLIDLQEKPTSGNYRWEAALVNRSEDTDLVRLEQKALIMAAESRSSDSPFVGGVLVQRLASLVADYMGGKISEPERMILSYLNLRNYLRSIGGNVVLPLGRITIGLARHRALMFKVCYLNPVLYFVGYALLLTGSFLPHLVFFEAFFFFWFFKWSVSFTKLCLTYSYGK